MKTRIRKWGNSLALRIPKAFAIQTGLAEESVVNLELVDGQLVIRPPARTPPTLEELLRKVTPENIHGEWLTGPAVGNEAW
jgi:antitoxin MazE